MLLYVFVSVLFFQNASNEYKYSIHTITLVYYTAVVVNFPFFVVAIIFVFRFVSVVLKKNNSLVHNGLSHDSQKFIVLIFTNQFFSTGLISYFSFRLFLEKKIKLQNPRNFNNSTIN